VLILLKKRRRERVWKAEGADCFRSDRAIGAFLIDHNADDLYVVRRIELLEHLLRVGHLRHRLG
jgi:hypothetical protein